MIYGISRPHSNSCTGILLLPSSLSTSFHLWLPAASLSLSLSVSPFTSLLLPRLYICFLTQQRASLTLPSALAAAKIPFLSLVLLSSPFLCFFFLFLFCHFGLFFLFLSSILSSLLPFLFFYYLSLCFPLISCIFLSFPLACFTSLF